MVLVALKRLQLKVDIFLMLLVIIFICEGGSLVKFGDNLKVFRKRKNMSQEDLADRVNVSRQSVSKWETGDAYPEMNNILELCKIFNCKINDLVHADMSDINSLDKEIVMKVVKFNEEQQKRVKLLSNVISMIGGIGKIVMMVAVPFVLIVMLFIPFVISNVKVVDSSLELTSDKIEVVDNKTIELFGVAVVGIDEEISEGEVLSIFEEYSSLEIILYLECGFIFLLVDIVVCIFILSYVEKLFKNIKDNRHLLF